MTNTASKIIESAIRDPGGEGMQTRHERRMRAMRTLGRAERRIDMLLKIAGGAAIAAPFVFILWIVLEFHP